MRLTPRQEYLNAQSTGVAFAFITLYFVAQVDLRDASSLMLPVFLYLIMQLIFRLGLKRTDRKRGWRNLLFIA